MFLLNDNTKNKHVEMFILFLWIKISKKLETKLMEDEVSEYYKGTEYTTKPSEELLKRYVVINSETKVTPSTAGTS